MYASFLLSRVILVFTRNFGLCKLYYISPLLGCICIFETCKRILTLRLVDSNCKLLRKIAESLHICLCINPWIDIFVTISSYCTNWGRDSVLQRSAYRRTFCENVHWIPSVFKNFDLLVKVYVGEFLRKFAFTLTNFFFLSAQNFSFVTKEASLDKLWSTGCTEHTSCIIYITI